MKNSECKYTITKVNRETGEQEEFILSGLASDEDPFKSTNKKSSPTSSLKLECDGMHGVVKLKRKA